jgi:imidazolonepropionase-like amidohydrolase
MIRKYLFPLLALLLVCPHLYAGSGVKAIVNAHIVNTDGSGLLQNGTIIIKDNVISEIGIASEIAIPQDAEVIDAKGKWIIPGLIDTHIHFFQSGGLYTRPDIIDLRKYVPYEESELPTVRKNIPDLLARYLRCGITSVVDMGGPSWTFKVRELAEKSDLAPRVAVAGPLISTYQPAVLTTEDPPIIKVQTLEEATKLVKKLIDHKTDLIKIWYIVLPGETAASHFPLIKAIIDESHRFKVRVAVHAPELETAKAAIRAGADILVHSVVDKQVDDEFITMAKSKGVILTPTLVVYEGYKEVLTKNVKLIPPEFEFVNPYTLATVFDLAQYPSEVIPEKRLEVQKRPRVKIGQQNLKKLHDAGITIAAGTDAGNIGTYHGASLFREFELMAEAGLSNLDILITATRNAAKLMGREKSLGTLSPGKLADLVILNANPLEDIRHCWDISAVMKDGKLYAPQDILKESNADLVQRQVNAYNARDIDAFLATYHEEIKLFKHPNELLHSGLGEIREVYTELFETSPNLHAQIRERIAVGNYVIDKEHVIGLRGRTEGIDAVAVYEVKEGRIINVWFLK